MTPFQIFYGSHPRGVLELRDVKDLDKRSAQVEEFSQVMKDIHDQVKNRLQSTNDKYKQ